MSAAAAAAPVWREHRTARLFQAGTQKSTTNAIKSSRWYDPNDLLRRSYANVKKARKKKQFTTGHRGYHTSRSRTHSFFLMCGLRFKILQQRRSVDTAETRKQLRANGTLGCLTPGHGDTLQNVSPQHRAYRHFPTVGIEIRPSTTTGGAKVPTTM